MARRGVNRLRRGSECQWWIYVELDVNGRVITRYMARVRRAIGVDIQKLFDTLRTPRDQPLAKCTLIRRILKQSSSDAPYLVRGIIRSATPPPTDFGVTRLERTTANRHRTSIALWWCRRSRLNTR